LGDFLMAKDHHPSQAANGRECEAIHRKLSHSCSYHLSVLFV
jgi:hypothetical protein